MSREDLAEHLGWLYEARLGMFIHSGPVLGRGSARMGEEPRARVPDEDYDTYFEHFRPTPVQAPEAWAREASNAGMRYFVVTTKHHEGFCLWDSQYTDYKATKTPARRDLLAPMVDSFHGEGLRVGFYHSLLDWHHPDFPVDGYHPQHDDGPRSNQGTPAATSPSTASTCMGRCGSC